MYYNRYKYDRYYYERPQPLWNGNANSDIWIHFVIDHNVLESLLLGANCSIVIPTSGTDVRADEIVIMIIVFGLWFWAIGLFIHR